MIAVASTGDGFAIRWPPGFTARFAPDLEVLDPGGKVVARGGESVTDAGGGGDPSSGAFYVCAMGGETY